MKKLKLKALELGAEQALTREQLKNVVAGSADGGCHDMSWSACMQCLLVAHCASDWQCVAACALAPEGCIGGAAVICMFN